MAEPTQSGISNDPAAPAQQPSPPVAHEEELFQYILDDLGGEGVDPDLSERNLRHCIKKALECWSKYRPFKAWFPFDVPSVLSGAENGFVISFFQDEARTDDRRYPVGFVRNVLDVRFVDRDRRILGPHVGSREGYFIRWGFQGPRLFFQLHVGERVYERLTGTRPNWEWNPTTRKLHLAVPSRDVLVMVLTSRERRVEEVRYDRVTDFRRLCVATAKRLLARIQGARGPIPGPAGNIETDAAELRGEAKDEWDEVETMLQTTLTSVPPVGYIG